MSQSSQLKIHFNEYLLCALYSFLIYEGSHSPPNQIHIFKKRISRKFLFLLYFPKIRSRESSPTFKPLLTNLNREGRRKCTCLWHTLGQVFFFQCAAGCALMSSQGRVWDADWNDFSKVTGIRTQIQSFSQCCIVITTIVDTNNIIGIFLDYTFLSGKWCTCILKNVHVGIRMTELEFNACPLVGLWHLTVYLKFMSQFLPFIKEVNNTVSEYYHED